ncbi:hypothetical protein HK096_001695, partial [Nowakowskiella sp. JEL0078]
GVGLQVDVTIIVGIGCIVSVVGVVGVVTGESIVDLIIESVSKIDIEVLINLLCVFVFFCLYGLLIRNDTNDATNDIAQAMPQNYTT